MAVDRSGIVDRNFVNFLTSWNGHVPPASLDVPLRKGSSLTGRVAFELVESQMTSRLLDLEARALKRKDEGYYTIGSSGHEGNVVLGRLLRADDPTFLHYRSGALMIERARQRAGTTPLFDILLSAVAAKDDPVSGGRHKVFGSRELWVPPQTSTIASHLPKALGAAFAMDRARRLGISLPVPHDAIVACSFGDASLNHNVAQGAFNAAEWATHQSLPVPLLFVCEDNRIGISVRTPDDWVEMAFRHRAHLAYFAGDGRDLVSAFDAAVAAIDYCRRFRRPAFLHLSVVRLMGHAGTDVETEYRSRAEIEAQEATDPLLESAHLLLKSGVATAEELLSLYESLRARITAASAEVVTRDKITTAEEVVAALAPRDDAAIARAASQPASRERRLELFAGEANLPEDADRPRHMAVQINRALLDGLAKYDGMMIFGEDVGRKGGVYHVTAGLADAVGVGRVFNTLLDETTILGVAIGAGHLGLLPVPEIQYLAYLHNAEDQLRGEACSLSFFSDGQFKNPMVVRIASFAYQRGFGGHFHNDNSIAVLRDIPGLVIAAPSQGDDAVRMLRTCLAAAKHFGLVVAFLEPIALYMTRDLHEKGDGLFETSYPPLDETISIGCGRVLNAHADDHLTIITYANGTYLSLRAARVLEQRHGVRARVVDLRWLAPLDVSLILEHATATGAVLIVDEGRRTGGVSEAILGHIAENLYRAMPRIRRLTAEDTYIPLGPAAHTVLPNEERIVASALALMAGDSEARED